MPPLSLMSGLWVDSTESKRVNVQVEKKGFNILYMLLMIYIYIIIHIHVYIYIFGIPIYIHDIDIYIHIHDINIHIHDISIYELFDTFLYICTFSACRLPMVHTNVLFPFVLHAL